VRKEGKVKCRDFPGRGASSALDRIARVEGEGPTSDGRREAERAAREQAFWDERVPTFEQCLREYEAGPDPNTKLMLDALEPLGGKQVLDFACGTGVTSAWLSARGAIVTGIDLSTAVVERASELAQAVGARASFVAADLGEAPFEPATFDGMVGRYALHHVDCATVAPALARLLKVDATGAFLETMDSNPLLRLARSRLVGRFGIPRYGTLDEHPLTSQDLDVLRRSFGDLRLAVAQMQFLRVFDRQVLGYRSRFASKALGALDDLLLSLGWRAGSYQQVLIVVRSPAGA
jgi:2-polyprenyl-3-methyl-5-hydroxy-6-metoxy-1,4-benzoquinol methylase